MTRHRLAGLFLLLAALWGTSFVATRAGLPYIPPVLFAALRFDAAGLLMLGYAVVATDQWRPRARADWIGVLSGGALFVALHHALLFTGQQYVTSAVAAVVISLDPVLAAGFARVLLPSERLTPLGIAGLLIGIVGVGIIANPDPSNLTDANLVGVSLVFLAAAAFALGAVVTSRYRTDLPVASMQAWMMLVGAPLLHLTSFALPGESFAMIEWTPTALAALGYLAVVAGGLGYLLYFDLLDRLGPIQISMVGYVIPLFAALGGWLLLDERPDPLTGVGFLVILLGFVLVKRRAIRAELAR